MPAGLVNQLMSCYWLEMGHELESADEREGIESSVMDKLEAIRKRVKNIKFNF